MRRVILSPMHAAVAAGILTLLAVPAQAQETKSAAGALELAQVLAAKKLDAIAARDPSTPNGFVAALAFPGQLMVVAASYPSPPLINERLARREYRDAYIELNASSALESRVFVTDIGADGLKPKIAKKAVAFDIRDVGGKQFKFDGNWREDKLSETEYMKVFAEADQHYANVVALLLAEAKK